jgi:hypothetical protein
MIRKVDMERFSVISSNPFDAVVAAIKALIGHPNMAELWQATQRATTAAELEAAIQPAVGESGLMQFVEFDHGMIVRKGDRAPHIQNHSSGHRKSSHHERNGEACSGRRLVCSGYCPRG